MILKTLPSEIDVPATGRRPIEAPVGSLNETGVRTCPVAIRERVEGRQRPRRRDLEDCPEAASATERRPVEVPVGSLNETGVRICPVASCKRVERRERPRRRDPEDAADRAPPSLVVP